MSIAKFYPPGLGGPVKVEFRSWVHAKIPCIHVVAPVPWSRPTNRTTKRVSRPRLRSQPAHRTPARSCSVLARPLRSSPLLVAPPPPGLAGSSCSPVAPRSPPVSSAPAVCIPARRRPQSLGLRRAPRSAAPLPRQLCPAAPVSCRRRRDRQRHRRAFCAYSREELVNALPHLRTRADAGGARTVEAC